MESRRDFLKKAAVAAAGLTIVPSKTIAGLGHKAPSDTMNIVGIGIGGKGHPNLAALKTRTSSGLGVTAGNKRRTASRDSPDVKGIWACGRRLVGLGAKMTGAL